MQVIPYFPSTKEGWQELARRVTDVHADYVVTTLHKLKSPAKQKLELLQMVIDTAKTTKHKQS